MNVPLSARVRLRFRRVARDQQLRLSALALVVGVVAGLGAVVFREMIGLSQQGFFTASTEHLATFAASLPGWRVVLAPALAGLFVGVFVKFALRDQRSHGVAEVIEASAIHGGRMTLRDGLVSAIVSAVSIGGGASVGREGPAIHLGAALASTCGAFFKLDRSQARIILGAGAASAIAASFNAPFAGVFFAHEVIIGHYALPAFAPVAIASVTGTVIARIYFGTSPAFIIAGHEISSFLEMPAFALLGVVCAFTAIAFIRLVPVIQDIHVRLKTPPWAAPAFGGLLVGIMALWFPEVLGVGYEATDRALNGEYLLIMLIALAVAKLLATVICLGSGFGGGVFSPSLFIGAMVGGAFGIVAALPFPELASSLGAYTITGMGATAAAVLGAPISTTLMIFELTGDYQLTIAVLIAVVVAMGFTRGFHGPSYFLNMLHRRGLDLRGGHDVGGLVTAQAGDLMREDHLVMEAGEALPALRANLLRAPHGEVFVQTDGIFSGRLMLSDMGELAYDPSQDEGRTVGELVEARELYVYREDSLQRVVELFSSTEDSLLAVLDNASDRRLIGCLHERDVMRAEGAYAKALEKLRAEEH
jgi:chloride channel protein, CIC family